MRKSLVMVLAAGLGLAGLAFAQQGGFQGRFGGGAGAGGSDPLQLLQNASVKKELELTDEQAEKLPDAVRKALGDVLNEKQQKRLRQIELQQRGSAALRDPKLQKELKVSEEQANNIKTILEDSRKEMTEAFKGGGGGGGEKIANLRKETNEKVMGVLTVDQRRNYKQMLGDEFKIERPTFGGFGGGNNKKRGEKKDKIQ